jgi:nucleoid-associated protein YgaU
LALPTRHLHAEPVGVRPGDSLWAIAARHLGPDATDAQIAAEWPRWYAANRAVIGDDPDIIEVGQQLLPPDKERAR